jgi:hypothetical protein
MIIIILNISNIEKLIVNLFGFIIVIKVGSKITVDF